MAQRTVRPTRERIELAKITVDADRRSGRRTDP